jgi:signal transduction histidine kinase
VRSEPGRSRERYRPGAIPLPRARTDGSAAQYDRRVWNRSALAAHGDVLVAGSIAVVYAVEVVLSGEVTRDRPAGVAVAVLFAASFLVRRTVPLLPLLAAVAVIQVSHTVLHGVAEGGSFLLGLVIALYSGTRHARGWLLPACLVVSVVLIPLAAIDPQQPPSAGDWIFFTTFLGFPTVAGWIFRRRHATDERLARENAELAADRDRRAAEAVAEERARIARELHDVVAHAISVIVLQARGGRRVLPTSPGQARAAFDTIESTGEQALEEMRRLLAMLRYDEDHDLAPQPGLRALDDLADSMARMGLPVEVVREGTPVALTAGVDLSAYRIVQEALTNALKHAGPATARVRVSYATGRLDLEVVDDGRGTGTGGGSGHGLVGMRERAALYGGHVEAGRCPEGGYAVRATLPTGATA